MLKVNKFKPGLKFKSMDQPIMNFSQNAKSQAKIEV